MPKITAQQAADKWANNSASASSRFQQGVQNTTKDVVGRAIAAQTKLRNAFNEAVDSGRWARNLNAVGNAGWKAKTAAKVSNYSSGISAGKESTVQAFTKLFQFEESLEQSIAQMPNETDADAEARALAWMRGMRSYKQQG